MTPKTRKILATFATLLFGLFSVGDVTSFLTNGTMWATAHPYRSACLILAIISLVIAFQDNLLSFFNIQRPARMMHIIKDFLLIEQGYTIKAANADSANFTIIAEREGSKLTIKKHPDKPLLQIQVTRLAEPDVTAPEMENISDYERAGLKDEIGIALGQMNSLHHFALSFNSKPFRAEAGIQISAQSFNEESLLNAVQTVEQAGTIIGLVWSKWFRAVFMQQHFQRPVINLMTDQNIKIKEG